MLTEDGQELILNVDIKWNVDWDKLDAQVKEAARLSMRDIVVEVTEGAVMDSPMRTGNNMRSLAGEVSGMGQVASGGNATLERVVDDSKIEGAVYSTSGYGGYLETGTGPHVIEVKNAKVLTDGKTFFGKKVQHPGTAPHPYIKPNVDRCFTEENFAENARRYL